MREALRVHPVAALLESAVAVAGLGGHARAGASGGYGLPVRSGAAGGVGGDAGRHVWQRRGACADPVVHPRASYWYLPNRPGSDQQHQIVGRDV